MFSVEGSYYTGKSPNTILDESNPTSMSGLLSIVELFPLVGRSINLYAPHDDFLRVWGPHGADTTPIIASWSLSIQDTDKNSVALRFDISNDGSPIKIRVYVKRYSFTDNLPQPNKLIINLPTENSPRTIKTYTSESGTFERRQRLLLVPKFPTSSGL